MRIYRLDDMKPGTILTCSLYSTTGKLLGVGNRISAQMLKILQRRGEPEIFGLEPDEESTVDRSSRMLKDEVHYPLSEDAICQTGCVHNGVYKYGNSIVWVIRDIESDADKLLEQLKPVQKAVPDTVFVWSDNGLKPITEPSVRYIAAHVYQAQKTARIEQQKIEELQKQKLEQQKAERAAQQHKQKHCNILVQWYQHSARTLIPLLFPECSAASNAPTMPSPTNDPALQNIISLIIEEGLLLENFVHKLSKSTYVATHAFQTSLLAVELAHALAFSEADTHNLGLAALFQDLGMFAFPKLLEKRTPLTPSELATIRAHPTRSVETLKLSRQLSDRVRTTVLQAHERLDGSGYPNQKTHADMDLLARVLSMVNMFVAMVSSRPYRSSYTTYEAARLIAQHAASQQIDPRVVESLFKYLDLYAQGTFVRLNTGAIARIEEINTAYLCPTVTILYHQGSKLDTPETIDLRREANHAIISRLHPEEAILDLKN